MNSYPLKNQDNLQVMAHVDADENYVTEVRRMTAESGVEVFTLIAETDDGDEAIGIFFDDKAEAYDAQQMLDEIGIVAGKSISATEYLDITGELYNERGAIYDNGVMTALELVNHSLNI